MPRRIVVVDEIPKGPTGKVQRIGLAERLGVAATGTTGERDDRPPYGFLEHELVAIWQSVLGIPGLGVADDFFALGGDSILGAEAVARIRELVGDHDLPLTSIVRAPTPAAMAHEIFAGIGVGRSGIVPLQTSGTRTPLFLVHPGDGDVLAYPVLARLLGPDQPSYALRARGIDDGRDTPSSLPELAAEYVASRPAGAAARALRARRVLPGWVDRRRDGRPARRRRRGDRRTDPARSAVPTARAACATPPGLPAGALGKDG